MILTWSSTVAPDFVVKNVKDHELITKSAKTAMATRNGAQRLVISRAVLIVMTVTRANGSITMGTMTR